MGRRAAALKEQTPWSMLAWSISRSSRFVMMFSRFPGFSPKSVSALRSLGLSDERAQVGRSASATGPCFFPRFQDGSRRTDAATSFAKVLGKFASSTLSFFTRAAWSRR